MMSRSKNVNKQHSSLHKQFKHKSGLAIKTKTPRNEKTVTN